MTRSTLWLNLFALSLGSILTVRAENTNVSANSASEEANDSCSSLAAIGVYDLGLHVASVFVLFIASGIGVFVPVLVGAASGERENKIVRNVLFALKHFGTGIIVSLAFCHLLQDAFETFTNECLGELPYEPTAPAIAMGSMLLIWLVDFVGARWAALRDSVPTQPIGPRNGEDDLMSSNPAPSPGGVSKPIFQDMCCEAGSRPLVEFDPASKRALWDVQLLEGGIVFHSIVIGVALGAQASGFAATFAALVFHQLFEGIGLGARIGALSWPKQSGPAWKKWLMCMAYTVITPIGIAIGIGVHQSFNENGRAELLAIGTLNAISAGILLYSGICQLLFSEWVVGDLRTASNGRVSTAIASLGLGLFAMSILGKWT